MTWGRGKRNTHLGQNDAEHLYRTLFDLSPDGVLVIDAETALPIEFNDVACEQLGYSSKEFARRRVRDVEAAETPEETAARVEENIRQVGGS